MEKKKDVAETVGARIRAARKRKGLTQEELAFEMCLCKQSISSYENDKAELGLSMIMEIAQLLDTTPAYLIGIEEEQDPYISEMTGLMRKIKDDRVKEMLLAQIRAVVSVYSEERM
jgi:transcriptional regulator with XRE-family HTH domain